MSKNTKYLVLATIAAAFITGVFTIVTHYLPKSQNGAGDRLPQKKEFSWGKVLDEYSKPIFNAEVKLEIEGHQVITVRTNSEGYFRYKMDQEFEKKTAVKIIILHPKYEVFVKDIILSGNSATAVEDIRLVKIRGKEPSQKSNKKLKPVATPVFRRTEESPPIGEITPHPEQRPSKYNGSQESLEETHPIGELNRR